LFKGQLLQPELARKWDSDHIEFRGKIIRVREPKNLDVQSLH